MKLSARLLAIAFAAAMFLAQGSAAMAFPEDPGIPPMPWSEPSE